MLSRKIGGLQGLRPQIDPAAKAIFRQGCVDVRPAKAGENRHGLTMLDDRVYVKNRGTGIQFKTGDGRAFLDRLSGATSVLLLVYDSRPHRLTSPKFRRSEFFRAARAALRNGDGAVVILSPATRLAMWLATIQKKASDAATIHIVTAGGHLAAVDGALS